MSPLIVALAAAIMQAIPTPPPQDPTAPTAQLDEVLVDGRRNPDAARQFVRSVAAPVGDRGLARWRDPICVGVANLPAAAAQQMADRVSDWAHSLGLEIGAPGCRPNIFIAATDDGDAMARDMVRSRRREFRTGVSGTDRGGAALRAFQNSGRLIRWWHVSLPVDDETGNPVRRLPGQAPVEWTGRRLEKLTDFGVNSLLASPSRLSSQIRDDLQQAIIVVDIDALDQATFAQVTDYVALVALAQIDAEAETGGFNTILNLFDSTAPAAGAMTDWDAAFLRGLYGAEYGRANPNADASAVADAMERSLTTDPAGAEERSPPPLSR